MNKFVYINSQNEEVNFLGEDIIITNADDIYSNSWKTETVYNKICGFKKKTSNYKIGIAICKKNTSEIFNSISDIFEKDIIKKEPGTLVCDDWYIKGYFTEKKVSSYIKMANYIAYEYAFTPDEASWHKECRYVYRINDKEKSDRGLNYPYDFPYDYISEISSSNLNNLSAFDADFIMTVYGPVIDPKVLINNHIYQIFGEITGNEYITINSKEKTIIRTAENGEKINEFANQNKESRIFENIPSGSNTIIINPNANVDIVLLYERSDPEWS